MTEKEGEVLASVLEIDGRDGVFVAGKQPALINDCDLSNNHLVYCSVAVFLRVRMVTILLLLYQFPVEWLFSMMLKGFK